MKKVPFFPMLGVLSGVAGVAAGFVTGASVRNIADSVSTPAVNYSDGYDVFSYYFGGAQSSASDTGAVMTAKLAEICGKGFGLLLIFLGLFMVCYFGWKIEKSLKEGSSPEGFMPPPPPAQGFYAPQDAPVQDAPQDMPVQDYAPSAGQDFGPGMDG